MRSAPSSSGVPEYLFHWTTAEALEDIAADVASAARFPLAAKIPRGSSPYRHHASIRGQRAIFGWIHPVTGMGWKPNALFAGADPNKARLLILKLNPRARVLRVSSPAEHGASPPLAAVRQAELLYHEAREDNYSAREWAVLNSEAVGDFTADPALLRRFLIKELARLEKPSYEYPQSLMHCHFYEYSKGKKKIFLSIATSGWLRNTIVIPRIKTILNLDSDDIPAPLRRTLEGRFKRIF
ncbi:MAG TPA: hypothetical protein VNK24_01955 [Elusimicrobiota bacterium]|nr:hypothetical protein [Elusimicrobiota bacterium]